MELKTFEELREEQNDFVWMSDAKAEAVKWVKEYEEERSKFKSGAKIHRTSPMTFIKHFFNLTEEDLEDKKEE